jgi:LPS export ABC transporter protein LptC
MRVIIVALVIVCAVVLGARTWLHHRHTSAQPQTAVHTPMNSDYYMKGATVYQLSQQGQLAYRMKVAQSLHFPDDSVDLSDIHMHYLKNTPTYWNLHADKGRIPAGQGDLYLYDGVIVHYPQEDGNILQATTTHAWVRPDDHLVDSDAQVTTIEPGRKTTGLGMRINLNTNKLNLLHNVHVTYTH